MDFQYRPLPGSVPQVRASMQPGQPGASSAETPIYRPLSSHTPDHPPAIKFGILDPISIGGIIAAGTAVGGFGIAKLRSSMKERKIVNDHLQKINPFLEEMGAKRKANAKTLYTLLTAEALLTSASGLTTVNELIPLLNLVESKMSAESKPLLRQLYLDKGISHPSKVLRQHFITLLMGSKAPRNVFDPYLKQLERESDPKISEVLGKPLLALAAPEDLDEFKAGLALPTSPVGFRKVCIQVLSQPQYFNDKVLETFITALKSEKNPEIITLLRDQVASYSNGNASELFTGYLHSENPELKRTALQYLGALNNPEDVSRILERFIYDAKTPLSKALTESYQSALKNMVKEHHHPLLVNALIQPTPAIQEMALTLMTHLQSGQSVKPLFTYLENPESQCLPQAVNAVAACAKYGDHPMLLKHLGSENENIRMASAKGLINIQDSEDLQPLIAAYEKETIPSISNTLIEALQKRNGNPEAFDALTQALIDSPSAAVKSIAIQSLKPLGMKAVPSMVKTLDKLLQMPKGESPKHLAKEIEQIILEAIQTTFLEPYKKNNYFFHYNKATVKPLYPDVVAALASRSTNVQAAAFEVVKVFPQAQATLALIDYRNQPDMPNEKLAWDLFFPCLDGEEKATLLPALLKKSTEKLSLTSREMIAHGVTKLGDAEHLPEIAALLSKETHPHIKTILITGIRNFAPYDKDNVQLEKILLKNENTETRKLAIELIALKNTSTFGPMLAAYENDDIRKNPELTQALDAGLLKRASEVQSETHRSGLNESSLQYFIRMLSLPSEPLERIAILTLLRDKQGAAIPGVLNYLDSKACHFPVEAEQMLTNPPVNATHRDLLKAKLSSPKEKVRLLSAKMYAKTLTAQDVPFYLERMVHENSPEIRNVFKEALQGNVNIPVEYWLRALEEHDDLGVRELVVNKLKVLDPGLAPLIGEMKDVSDKIDALDHPPPKTGEKSDLSKEDATLKNELLVYKETVENALLHLFKILQGNRLSTKSLQDNDIPLMVKTLRLPSDRLQEVALTVLKGTNANVTQRPVAEIFQFLEDNASSRLVPLASEALLSNIQENHQPLLREKLKSRHKNVQMIAAQALQKIGKEVELSTFFNILEKDETEEPNQELLGAIKALGKSAEAFDFLNDILLKKTNPTVLGAAIQGLRAHHGIKALPSLLTLMSTRPEILNKNLIKQVIDAIVEQFGKAGKPEAESLFKGLMIADETIQTAALNTIKAKFDDKNPVLVPLLNYIESPNCKLRAAAIGYLEGSVVNANNRDVLLSKLDTPEKTLRLSIYKKLKSHPVMSDIPLFFEQLAKEQDPAFNTAINDTLASQPTSDPAFSLLSKALNENNSLAVKLATIPLLKNHGTKALPVLMNALEEISLNEAPPETGTKVSQERIAADASLFNALEQGIIAILDATKAANLIVPANPSQEAPIFSACKSPSEAVQAKAFKILGAASTSQDFIAPLFRYLASNQCKHPQIASEVLSKSLNAGNHLMLMDHLFASQVPVRLAAANGLAKLIQSGDLPTVLRALSAEQNEEVAEKLNVLVQKCGKDKGTFQFLALELLENPNSRVKNAVVLALQDHGINALKPLFQSLEETNDKTPIALVRDLERAIVKVIADNKDESGIPTLIEKVDSTHKNTQRVSVLALFPFVEKWEKDGSYDTETTLNALRVLTKHKNAVIQEPAARTLKKLIKNKVAYLQSVPVSTTTYGPTFTQSVADLAENAQEEEVKTAAKDAHGRLLLHNFKKS